MYVDIPQKIYYQIISEAFPTHAECFESGVNEKIYTQCDKILGVKFVTTESHMYNTRIFKCKVIDEKKWVLARLKYSI